MMLVFEGFSQELSLFIRGFYSNMESNIEYLIDIINYFLIKVPSEKAIDYGGLITHSKECSRFVLNSILMCTSFSCDY